MRLEERYSRKDKGWGNVHWRKGGGWLGGRRHSLRTYTSLCCYPIPISSYLMASNVNVLLLVFLFQADHVL